MPARSEIFCSAGRRERLHERLTQRRRLERLEAELPALVAAPLPLGRRAQAAGQPELAEVVRNLSLRDGEKGLSTGEKQMYVKAKKILASELMYAKDMDEETCADWLEEVLASDSPPPKKKPAAKKKAAAAATA